MLRDQILGRAKSRVRVMIALSAVAAACRTVPVRIQDRTSALESFELPEPELAAPARRLSLWATYYSVPVVRGAGKSGVPLVDMRGRALGPRLSLRDFCDAAMEGTVQIDGRTYNYAGQGDADSAVDCSAWYAKHPAIGRSRFRATTHPFGESARGGALVPFRTIAADPAFVPAGATIYIPAARGVSVRLPSGKTVRHDGYFFAEDRGGAVKSNHIDIFIGPRGENPFAFVKSHAGATFEAYLIPAR